MCICWSRLEPQQVVYERRLMVNAITFKPEQYATVKEFFDRAQQADQAALSLRQR